MDGFGFWIAVWPRVALASRMMKSRLGRALFTLACLLIALGIFADVISGILGYRLFYTDIRDTGFITNPYAMKVAAVILALVCYLAVGEMMRRMARGHLRHAVFFFVGWLVIYWSTMFGFSSRQLFGLDGPKYSYIVFSDGQIALRDIDLVGKPDPETGRILKPLTPEIADKYRQQQGQEVKSSLRNTSSASPSLWNRLFGGSAPEYDLQVEIEKIEIRPGGTFLYFAVTRSNNNRLGRFYRPYGCYLSDETGTD